MEVEEESMAAKTAVKKTSPRLKLGSTSKAGFHLENSGPSVKFGPDPFYMIYPDAFAKLLAHNPLEILLCDSQRR